MEGSTVTDESLEEEISTSTCIKFTFFIQRKHHWRLLKQDLNIFFCKDTSRRFDPLIFFSVIPLSRIQIYLIMHWGNA